MQRVLLVLCAIAGFAPAIAFAEMSCSALGSYLATQPNISQYVPPPTAQVPSPAPVPFTTLVAATTPPTNAARCEANFIYSAKGGPADGYAVGQNQRIGIRAGFPLNTLDGGSGGAQDVMAVVAEIIRQGLHESPPLEDPPSKSCAKRA